MRSAAVVDARGGFAIVSNIVPSTTKPGKRSHSKSRQPKPQPRFWARKSNPELDRAGDWLLEHLSAMRREAPARASAR